MQTFRILMGEKVSGVMCDETARMKGKKRKGSEVWFRDSGTEEKTAGRAGGSRE